MPKTCCGNCTSGKPCCSTKTKPRPAFERRRGLWLPRRDLTIPKNLLQYPSEAEWSGLWRPWKPLLMPVTFDLSCLPCCQELSCCCEDVLCVAGPPPRTCVDLKATITNATLCDGTGCFAAPVVIDPLTFNGFTNAWEAGPIVLGCGETLGGFSLTCGFATTCLWSVSFSCAGVTFTSTTYDLNSCDPLEIQFTDACGVGSACCPDAGPTTPACVDILIELS